MKRTTKPESKPKEKQAPKPESKKENQESVKTSPDKILWIKTGGGYFVINDQTYYPGDKFEATETEIRECFRNTIKKVSDLSESELEQLEKERVKRPPYMERKPGGKYYVYAKGQRVNDTPVSRAEAEKLLSEQ